MKLWKENKLSQEWELSNTAITKQFCKSKFCKLPMTLDRKLRLFITSLDGLNSSFEEGSGDGRWEQLYEAVYRKVILEK